MVSVKGGDPPPLPQEELRLHSYPQYQIIASEPKTFQFIKDN